MCSKARLILEMRHITHNCAFLVEYDWFFRMCWWGENWRSKSSALIPFGTLSDEAVGCGAAEFKLEKILRMNLEDV